MLKKQKGLTAISWIIVLGLVGIQAMLALRIAPIYMNDRSIKSVLEGVAADSEARGRDPAYVKDMIDRRLLINGIRDIQQDKKAFIFKRTPDNVIVTLHYEKRGPIFGNLEFVAAFDHKVSIPNR